MYDLSCTTDAPPPHFQMGCINKGEIRSYSPFGSENDIFIIFCKKAELGNTSAVLKTIVGKKVTDIKSQGLISNRPIYKKS